MLNPPVLSSSQVEEEREKEETAPVVSPLLPRDGLLSRGGGVFISGRCQWPSGKSAGMSDDRIQSWWLGRKHNELPERGSRWRSERDNHLRTVCVCLCLCLCDMHRSDLLQLHSKENASRSDVIITNNWQGKCTSRVLTHMSNKNDFTEDEIEKENTINYK